MLAKVTKLSHIGRFQSLQHRAERFRKLALLFARNGYGKTTLCAVIRSSLTQDAKYVDERAHLGQVGLPSATLEFDPVGTVAFNNGAWNRSPPPLLIFDQEYIRANVHAAEEVTRDNKRQLLQIIIGAAGVTMVERLKVLDDENAGLNAALRVAEASIQRHQPSINDVGAFVAAVIPVDLDIRLVKAARLAEQADQAAEITRQSGFDDFLPGLRLQDLPRLLVKTMGIDVDTVSLVDQHVAKHHFDQTGRRWLRYGVDHAGADDCPFCDQSLALSSIIGPLRATFDPRYKDYADAVEVAHVQIQAIADGGARNLLSLLEQNEAREAFWLKVVEIDPLPRPSTDEQVGLRRALSWIEAALKLKMANVGASVDVTEAHLKDWSALVDFADRYRRAVQAANAIILNAKSAEGKPTLQAIETARTNRAKFNALSRRDDEPLKGLCADWSQKDGRQKAIALEKKAIQDALRKHTVSSAAAYEDSVNQMLGQFGANFKLCQTKASYVGGANSEYCIDINGHALAVGPSGKASPSFRTVLSGGDKASLALALFITQARQRADLADLTLIFDDPFSSQDAGRQFETSARIRELAAAAKQVVVLSHDARFLHLIKKDAGALEASEHQVVLTADWHGTVSAWSADDEVRAEYIRRAERIRGYAGSGQHLTGCSPQQLASDIRVFLEEYVDLLFPGRFAARTTLGTMVDEIDDAGPNDPLHLHRIALRDLNEFSRPDHHRGTQPPDPTQLRAQCRKVVGLIGAY